MSRVMLAGLALIGLAACGGAKPQPKARTRSQATAPAATRPTTTQPKRKTASPADTSKRNPLTND